MTPIVKNYLLILGSKLVDQDRKEATREAKRGHVNIYRLGLLLEAANKVAADVRGHEEEGGPEAIAALKRSLSRRFDPIFPPIKTLLKLIDSNPTSLAYGPDQRPARGKAKTAVELEREVNAALRSDESGTGGLSPHLFRRAKWNLYDEKGQLVGDVFAHSAEEALRLAGGPGVTSARLPGPGGR